MKKLKPNQIGPFCSFCPPRHSRAVYREDGFANVFCCCDHTTKLLEYEKDKIERDSHITEADYQTWLRL